MPVLLRCERTNDPTLKIGDVVERNSQLRVERATELRSGYPVLVVVSKIRFGQFVIIRDSETKYALEADHILEKPPYLNFRRNDLRICVITACQKMPPAWIRGSARKHNNLHHMGWYYQFKCGEEDSRLHKRNGQTASPATCLMCLAA